MSPRVLCQGVRGLDQEPLPSSSYLFFFTFYPLDLMIDDKLCCKLVAPSKKQSIEDSCLLNLLNFTYIIAVFWLQSMT